MRHSKAEYKIFAVWIWIIFDAVWIIDYFFLYILFCLGLLYSKWQGIYVIFICIFFFLYLFWWQSNVNYLYMKGHLYYYYTAFIWDNQLIPVVFCISIETSLL